LSTRLIVWQKISCFSRASIGDWCHQMTSLFFSHPEIHFPTAYVTQNENFRPALSSASGEGAMGEEALYSTTSHPFPVYRWVPKTFLHAV